MREIKRYNFLQEELMDIKAAPLSKRRPECLDVAYNKYVARLLKNYFLLLIFLVELKFSLFSLVFLPNCYSKHGIWDPERWHLDRKRSETPPEDDPANRNDHVPDNHAKRRSGDPRERIRKEQDGIVLSPQRRSFNSGCFVNVSQPPPRRPESPLGKVEVGECMIFHILIKYMRKLCFAGFEIAGGIIVSKIMPSR